VGWGYVGCLVVVCWVRGYLWLSMVSVKADVEAAGVGVSGLGLPMVVYGICEGWCTVEAAGVDVSWVRGYLWLSMVSVKAGVEAAGVDVSWVRGYLWLSMVSVKAGVEAAGVDLSWVWVTYGCLWSL
jgi:hypothetical protein